MRYLSKIVICLFLLTMLLITSCSDSSVNAPNPDSEIETLSMNQFNNLNTSQARDLSSLDLNEIKSFDDINVMLKENGLNISIAYAETVTRANGAETAEGQTIFANDRTKRLTAQWVPGDTRRNADGNNLTYTVWDPFAIANFGLPNEFNGTPAIDASFYTWNTFKKGAKLNIVKRPNTVSNPSAILSLGGVPGNPFLADISQVGILPAFLFDAVLGAGASSNVLGVAFTFVFIDDDGNPTDINNDGFSDISIKEVWYNDGFNWTDSGNPALGVDLETVALHENGHALGFGHFGKISVTNRNNKLHVSPRAVMNAVILGTQRTPLGTDKASFNSIYGNWPKN